VDIASKGGNYLLNVGPTAEGLIPEPSIERLKEVGTWMKENGQAVYGTSASPFARLPWGRCTKKETADGTTLYLHVFDWPKDGRLVVPGLRSQVQYAHLLKRGVLGSQKRIWTESNSDGVTIQVPAEAPNSISSTVVLNLRGPLVVEQPAETAAR
jgi:alpha-L-fucosidase